MEHDGRRLFPFFNLRPHENQDQPSPSPFASA
jgi:hypothetical protein